MAKTVYQVARNNNTILSYYELQVEKDPVEDWDVVRKIDLAGVVLDIESYVGNGLTYNATTNKIDLGGLILANTVITANGNNFSIVAGTNGTGIGMFPSSGIINLTGNSTGSPSFSTAVLQPNAAQIGLKRASDGGHIGFIWTYSGGGSTPRFAVYDDVYQIGMRYAANYYTNNSGANYNARWIPDQEAVINIATGVATDVAGDYGILSFSIWNPGATYLARSAVFRNNSTYIALVNVPAGAFPESNSSYWQPLAVGLFPRGVHVAGNTYYIGDYVTENGSGYVCYVQNSDSLAPSANPTKWALFAAKGADGTASSAMIQLGDTIADMTAYTGSLLNFAVTDSLRGGIFRKESTGYTVDNGIVFAAAGGGFWVREYDTSESIPATWYGAKGDWTGSAGTDDTAAINAAISAVNQIKAALGESKLLLPQTVGIAYRITAPLNPINPEIDVVAEMPILVDSTNESPSVPWVTIGDAGSVCTNRVYKLAGVTRRTNSVWTSTANIGIKLINLSSCDITIDLIKSFTVGLELTGNTKQCAYNKFNYGQSLNNQFGTKVTCTGAGGFCNENNFGATRYGCDTSLNLTLNRYGVWITSDSDLSYIQNNGNKFVGSSFELNATGAGISYPIWIEYGVNNSFIQCRSANADQYAVMYGNLTGGNAENNYVHFVYFAHTSFTGSPRNYTYQPAVITMNFTVVSNAQQLDWPVTDRPLFNSGYLYKKINDYAASNVAIAGHHFIASSTTLTRTIQATTTTAVTVNTDESINITTAYAMVRWARTTRCKRFHVMYSANASRGGRFFVRMTNAAGTEITSGLKSSLSMSHTTSYGGCFRSGVDGAGNDAVGLTFEVTSDCVLVEVGFTGGTNPLQIYHWDLLAFNDNGSISSFCLANTDDNVGTRIPQPVTNLTPPATQKVWSILATQDTGDPAGWYNTPANGWKAFGTLL